MMNLCDPTHHAVRKAKANPNFATPELREELIKNEEFLNFIRTQNMLLKAELRKMKAQQA